MTLSWDVYARRCVRALLCQHRHFDAVIHPRCSSGVSSGTGVAWRQWQHHARVTRPHGQLKLTRLQPHLKEELSMIVLDHRGSQPCSAGTFARCVDCNGRLRHPALEMSHKYGMMRRSLPDQRLQTQCKCRQAGIVVSWHDKVLLILYHFMHLDPVLALGRHICVMACMQAFSHHTCQCMISVAIRVCV